MKGNAFELLFVLLVLGLSCIPAGDPAGDSGLPADQASVPGTSTEVGIDTLRVATSGDYPPFSLWPESTATPRGFSIDLAHAFAADLGLELELVRFRWPSLEADLVARRFDLALSGVTVRPDRSTLGRFSVPVAASGAVVLVPDAGPLGGLADLEAPGLRLAVNAGGHLERVARRLFPDARVAAIADNAAVLDRLAAGAVDGVVTDSVEAPLWQARRPGLRGIGPLTRDHKAALIASDRPTLARRLDRWLLDAEASGRLARLRRRHGLPPERTAEPGAALLAGLDERLALMPAVARAKAAMGLAVEDRPREARVLDAAVRAVTASAQRRSRPAPPEQAVRRLFRAQIEAAKWIQQRTRAGDRGPTDPAAAGAELAERLRPALIRIGDRLADLLVTWSTGAGRVPSDAEVAAALSRHELSMPLVAELAASLRALRPDAGASASARPPRSAARDTGPSA